MRILLNIFVFLLSVAVLANNTPPEPQPAAPGPPPPVTPIDGEVWVLLLVGVLYLFYKYKIVFKRS